MSKFSSGFIAGSLLGAAGIAVVMSDRRNRKNVMREGRKAIRRAGHLMENVTDMF